MTGTGRAARNPMRERGFMRSERVLTSSLCRLGTFGDENDIAFLKWDDNRNWSEPGRAAWSTESGKR
jgi:hypothetical protein